MRRCVAAKQPFSAHRAHLPRGYSTGNSSAILYRKKSSSRNFFPYSPREAYVALLLISLCASVHKKVPREYPEDQKLYSFNFLLLYMLLQLLNKLLLAENCNACKCCQAQYSQYYIKSDWCCITCLNVFCLD